MLKGIGLRPMALASASKVQALALRFWPRLHHGVLVSPTITAMAASTASPFLLSLRWQLCEKGNV